MAVVVVVGEAMGADVETRRLGGYVYRPHSHEEEPF